MMDYDELLHYLDELLVETYSLWDTGWVTFNWRGYTYDHVQRVRGLALNLCRQEGGDPVVTELAAILHDITKLYDGEYMLDQEGKRLVDSRGYWRNCVRRPARSNAITALYERLGLAGQLHNESGGTVAFHLLKEHGLDQPLCARVADTICDHLRPPRRAEIESRCLYDADTIDANIGLPAFVRNIYINVHFHDARKSPETPPIATLLRDAPQDFLRPYIRDSLPRWVGGKRRDFMPRLRTESARILALARLERLEGVFACLARELEDHPSNSHDGCLSVALHFMHHRGDPSIAEETAYLVGNRMALSMDAKARAMLTHLQREMSGLE